MRVDFQTAPASLVIWNLQKKILYILGRTELDKNRSKHREQQILLSLTQFWKGLVT